MKIARRTTALFALVGVAALSLAACGSDDSSKPAAAQTTAAASSATTAAAASATTQPSVDLSGVTLRVGDQADNHVKAILEASGEGAKAPYKIEWSTFQNGPLLIAAATGGSIDLGKLSETPLIFAQAAGSPVKVVYAAKPKDKTQSSLNVVVKKESTLQGLADLKGKKVGYAQGTVLHYLLANALNSVGLKLSDVTLVNIQPGVDVLGRGDVDAIVTGDPTMSIGLVAGTTRILASGAGFTPGFYYLTARAGALSDPKLAAAIGDFAERTARAEVWFNEHPDDAVKIVVAQSKVTPEVAKAIITRAPVVYGPIDADIIAAHQTEADFFLQLGVVKSKLDAAAIFDTRYGGKK